MECEELQRAVEAVLFAAGEPVEVSRLAAVFEVDESDIVKAITILSDELAFQRRGIRIIKLMDHSYQGLPWNFSFSAINRA